MDWITIGVNLNRENFITTRHEKRNKRKDLDTSGDINKNKGHSSGIESTRMRGSDAGHMGAGLDLSSGQEYDGLGPLSRQARSSPVHPVCPAM